MLAACHERMHAQLATLSRLVQWLPTHGADAEAAQAARAVMRYFDLAAVNHHLDEERDLLPAMLARAPADERDGLRTLVERILAEHRTLIAAWTELRIALEAIAAGRSAALDGAQVERFRAAYAAHIALEESQILPRAARMLGAAELSAMSAEMTARRRAPGSSAD